MKIDFSKAMFSFLSEANVRQWFQGFFLIMALVFFSSCLKTRSELRGGSDKPLQDQVVDLQERESQAVLRFQEYDEQMRSFNGRIEDLESRMDLVTNNAEQGGEKVSSEALDAKLKLYEEALLNMETDIGKLRSEVEQLKKKSLGSPSAPSAPGPSGNLGNYSGAELSFSKKNWKDAIVGYQKYRELNPRGRRYADATYKIGVSFQELGMKSEAKSFFQEVIDKFPTSNEAKKAKYRLNQITAE